MRCLARCTVTLLALVFAAMVSLGAAAWFAAGWLNTGDGPVKSDAMLVLAGEPARFLYAAELYVQGYAPRIYVSRPVRLPSYRIFDDLGIPFPLFEDLYRDVLIHKGVSEQQIHYFGEALSTADEAIAARELTVASGIKSLLIVTSPYHVRRVKMIFHDVLPDTSITVVATPYEPWPEKWWSDQDTARNVLLETAKIAFYRVGGRFTSAARGTR